MKFIKCPPLTSVVCIDDGISHSYMAAQYSWLYVIMDMEKQYSLSVRLSGWLAGYLSVCMYVQQTSHKSDSRNRMFAYLG